MACTEHETAIEWLPVPGFEGRYERNKLGQYRGIIYKPGIPRRVPLMLKQTVHVDGYLWVLLRKEGGGDKGFSVAATVLELNVGPRPEGMQACHNNGVRDDNRIENLRWDTIESNMQDKWAHGTMPHGTSHHGAKLSEAGVRLMRFLRDVHRVSCRDLSLWFMVSVGTVKHVCAGKNWKHVPMQSTG